MFRASAECALVGLCLIATGCVVDGDDSGPPGEGRLIVEVSGPGVGTVTSKPAGIQCPGACEAGFPPGTQVDLSIVAEEGSRFVGWTGSCFGDAGCTVTVKGDVAAGAVLHLTGPRSVAGLGIGSDGWDHGTAVAVAPDGSVIVGGMYAGELQLGSETLSNSGGSQTPPYDMYLARLSAGLDQVLWARSLGGAETELVAQDRPAGVHVGEGGDVFVGGTVQGDTELGTGLLSAGPFAARFDGADGSVRWATEIPEVSHPGNYLTAATLIGGQRTVVAGNLFNPYWGFFVSLVDGAGNVVFVRLFQGSNAVRVNGISVDGSGRILVAGRFQGTLDFGDGGTESVGNDDGFLAWLDPTDGSVVHRLLATGPDYASVSHAAPAANGALIVTGEFSDSVVLGEELLYGAGNYDGLLARVGPDLSVEWLQRFGGSSNGRDVGKRVAVLPGDEIVLAAEFVGPASFGGPKTINGIGDSKQTSVAVVGYGPDGTLHWTHVLGTSSKDQVWDLALGRTLGTVVVTGEFESAGFEGLPGDLGFSGISDAFVGILEVPGSATVP